MAMTKRDYFNELLGVVAGNEALTTFINHEIELLNKKNSAPKAPTQKQMDNMNYKNQMLKAMGTSKWTVSQITKDIFNGDLTSQRVAALVTQLVNDGKLVRTVEKRKAYFEVA